MKWIIILYLFLLCAAGLSACDRGRGAAPAAAPPIAQSADAGRAVGGGTEAGAKYAINMTDAGGVRVCQVVFSPPLPPPTAVDRIVRTALESAARKDRSRDVLAAAFLGEAPLNESQYSGDLVYKAAQKKILTMDEYQGAKTTTSAAASYFVQTEEENTHAGVTPAKSWLILTLVFPKTPTREAAYAALLTEIEKVAGRGVEVNAHVSVGDKSVKTSWQELRDADGTYVSAEYDPDTKQVEHMGKVLKQFN